MAELSPRFAPMAEPSWGNVSAVFKESVGLLIEAYAKEVAELKETHAKEVAKLTETIASIDGQVPIATSPDCSVAQPRCSRMSNHSSNVSFLASSDDILPFQASTSLHKFPQSAASTGSPLSLRRPPPLSPRRISTNSFMGQPSINYPQRPHRSISPTRRASGRPSAKSVASLMSDCSSPMTFHLKRERHHCKSKDFADTNQDPTIWETSARESTCSRCVHSTAFEAVFAVLIVFHAVFTGVQIEHAPKENDITTSVFPLLDYAFGLSFTLELVMRVVASGCYRYLWASRELGWNYLDIVVVVLCWVEAGIQITASISDGGDELVNMSPVRMLRMVRFARAARVMRLGRIFKMVRSLHFLVVAILHSLQAVFWSMVIIFIVIYIFALVLRQAASEIERIEGNGGKADKDFDMYWGSLGRSMFTLFKAIAGGLSWHDCVVPLARLSGIWTSVFILYICFATFAVFNVMTGVFCKSAIEGAQSDKEFAVQQHKDMRQGYEDDARKLFKEINSDDRDSITLDEFERHWNSEEAYAFFASMDIELDQAWDLFQLLDKNAEGYIDVEEFVYGCLHLNGNATAISAANLTLMTSHLDSRLARLRLEQKKAWQDQKKQSAEQKKQSQYLQALDSRLHTLISFVRKLPDNGLATGRSSELQLGPQNQCSVIDPALSEQTLHQSPVTSPQHQVGHKIVL